ncbi:hypothetical protein [Halobaculum sp. MBLA0143]|uniref:hypothetical protein n=1 Tax=Halobaculum sp. MBLA0143 TaxID=3079933 RepID=UPI0035255DA2
MDRQTRRGLLIAVGGLTATVAAVGDRRSSPWGYSVAADPDGDTDDTRLRVAWYTRYDGVVTTQDGSVDAETALDPDQTPAYREEAASAVVTVGNVVPGDDGRLAIGLLAADRPNDDEGVAVWLRPSLTESENGVTDPEAAASDEGPGGELGAALETVVWRDDGLVGACDGTQGIDEPTVAEGSLRGTVAALSDGYRVADCLSQGSRVCLGLSWSLPADVGDYVQTDEARLDLVFAGVPCGSPNPFGGSP